MFLLPSETPWGSMPYLTVDDKTTIGQSIAVTRYAARQAKLVGKTDEETAQLDAIVDAINDFRGLPWELMFTKDAEKVRLKPTLPFIYFIKF